MMTPVFTFPVTFFGASGCEFSSEVNPALSTDPGSFANWGYRVVVEAAALGDAADKIRITIEASSSGSLELDEVTVGHQASSGDAYDMADTPVQVTFDGGNNNTGVISSGGTKVSDDIGFAYDGTSDLVIHCGVNATNANSRSLPSLTNWETYRKSGGNGDGNTANVTGYSADHDVYHVTEIEMCR